MNAVRHSAKEDFGAPCQTRDSIHDDPGEKKTRARHEQRRDRIDREADPEIGRTPDEVERRESGDDREVCAAARSLRSREAIFRPGIGGVAVTAHFPEAELVFRGELDRLDELGAFPGVELGNDDPGRAAVLARDRFAVELASRSGRRRRGNRRAGRLWNSRRSW